MKIARRIATGVLMTVIGLGVAGGLYLHQEGYRAYIIHTGSMTGAYNSGGLVIDRPANTSPLRVGQTITYMHGGPTPELITHRIVALRDGKIRTKGDANKIRDTWSTYPDQVRGVVVRYLPYMGYVVYFMSHRAGDAAVATGLLAMILLWDLFWAGVRADPLELRDWADQAQGSRGLRRGASAPAQVRTPDSHQSALDRLRHGSRVTPSTAPAVASE